MSPYRQKRPALPPVEKPTPKARPVRTARDPGPTLRDFAETYCAYPVGSEYVEVNYSVPLYTTTFWFSSGTGKDARVFKIAVSDQLIVANAHRGPGRLMDAVVDAIRKGVSPWPLECDVRWFRARAIRWFRRSAA